MYCTNNTYYADRMKYIKLLYSRHLERGHQPEQLKRILLKAHKKLRTKKWALQPPSTELPLHAAPKGPRRTFLHFDYHANNIPASTDRCSYKKHCSKFEQLLDITPPTICYHRPTNIGDLANRAKLYQAAIKEVSHYMGSIEKGLNP